MATICDAVSKGQSSWELSNKADGTIRLIIEADEGADTKTCTINMTEKEAVLFAHGLALAIETLAE